MTQTSAPALKPLAPTGIDRPGDSFVRRHVGPGEEQVREMLDALGLESLEALIGETVPAGIRLARPLELPEALSEADALAAIRELSSKNRVFRSFIGMGYHGCLTPPVIQRNVLENPGWYTQYTPYQAEIAQGRLEALLNFQTLVADLTGLPLTNASLLDEGTAAAEAMTMCRAVGRGADKPFVVDAACHPQTISVVRTRAASAGVEIEVCDAASFDLAARPPLGVLVQYPNTEGRLVDWSGLAERVHAEGGLLVVACDPLALVLARPPGEFGADIAVGSAQRFGVPMGYGGPHAAFLATREAHKRLIPGRLVGVSHDAEGRPAYRLALQTREQHIRRDKATSNICTAQVLLAVMASFYAVYHGPEGLRAIATRVHRLTATLAAGLKRLGRRLAGGPFFDTLRVELEDLPERDALAGAARERGVNLRVYDDAALGVALDETASIDDVDTLLRVFARGGEPGFAAADVAEPEAALSEPFARTGEILTHPVFHQHRSEHEMLRYIRRLESRDLSLTHSMIPLGSCTMKLNATVEMLPITWPELARLHPFAPEEQARGYRELFRQLEAWLAELTGFAAISLQPNAGSQGEYAGLLGIRGYHQSRGDEQRDVCLIPISAHGTNAASAVMAGLRVVSVACDERGNIDLEDLGRKTQEHGPRLAALMVTYPSTHGVFEEGITEVCRLVHAAGGQVYMDGANMNAQVGLTRPGDIGADVCHLNLHKTFCIPHGGGGPGVGPIGVAEHLAPFLPGHPFVPSPSHSPGAVAAAPWGSASILPISWVYIAAMGPAGLKRASEVAILNANYMASRLDGAYRILYRGERGRVGHEFIVDGRPFKSAGIEVEDIAKRLMDYGFHAPTMSFPVAGTLMIEPTESESKPELDRFCEAMLQIREEIRDVEEGRIAAKDSPLKHAPHTARAVVSDTWDRAYPRERGAFPAPWTREQKFWPPVARIDNAYGDRNLVCTCPPLEDLAE